MGMYFIMKEQNESIFWYIWGTGDGGDCPPSICRIGWNLMRSSAVKTLVPDEKGVGYLAVSQEQRENKALKAYFQCVQHTSVSPYF